MHAFAGQLTSYPLLVRLPIISDVLVDHRYMFVVHLMFRWLVVLILVLWEERGDAADDDVRVHTKVWRVECDHAYYAVSFVGRVCGCICC